ncbi:hypothetical protein K458DRAFT_366560 [Lentithecium fluviatile CBS 122367]|uniref:CENP-V/GFA domain-containing protein n=1 Tax=Lentithecium fluviatile CBS 122367 TaxID=1168545 RepID=A0A6G1J187_9PLEO|nr:hypothetical protein K458DRAFT_366560 [Lentithecium fluviatile CBS 122367]
MASEQDLVTVTAHCLCKANIFTTKVSKSELPLKAMACHCDSCRHLTGALFTVGTRWPNPSPNIDISALKTFHFGPSCDTHFCGTCSTPLFFTNPKDPNEPLGIATGALENTPEELVKIVHHIFVEDTKDGGASVWMRKVNKDGVEAKRFKERSRGENAEEYPADWPAAETLTGYETRRDESVPIRCKCEGVDLVWHRGNYEGKKKEELPWIIDPTTHKSLAGFCACDSCRVSGGIDVCNWAFGELENISFNASANKTFPNNSNELRALVDAKDPSIGTLTYYASSPDVQRYFCSNCAACIFYATDDRPQIVDIAVGVLRASDGARAEGFLSWAFGVFSHIGDSKGGWRHGFFERVAKESDEWREERGYPKNWLRVAREQAAAKQGKA